MTDRSSSAVTNFAWRMAPYVFTVSAIGAAAILFTWNPATTRGFPPCPFRALTGYFCPGCGSTRAMHQLLHLQIGNAFRLNPLLVVSIPCLVYAVAARRWPALRVAAIERMTSTTAWPLVILAVVVLFWFLRNLPIEPFSSLAPH